MATVPRCLDNVWLLFTCLQVCRNDCNSRFTVHISKLGITTDVLWRQWPEVELPMLHSEPCNMYANSAGPDRVQKSCRYFFLFDFDSKLEARNEQKQPRNSLVVWAYAWEAISNTGREEKDTFAVTQVRERKVPAIKSFAHLHSDPAHLTSSRDPSSPKKNGKGT